MPASHKNELIGLDKVYRTALRVDISSLCKVVERWAQSHMLMVGSGGSYSVATFAADLHEWFTGKLARAATPLEITSNPDLDCGVACFSARGQNHDIVSAFRTAALSEIDPLAALILAENSQLQKMGTTFRYTDVISVSRKSFSDGYLAVASMIGSALLLIRAYRQVIRATKNPLPQNLRDLMQEIAGFSAIEQIFEKAKKVVNGRAYLNVLYSPELKAAAIDLESRFTEAALGPVQISDFRNFGHGRHFWLSRKGKETSVLALMSNVQQSIGSKTIALLPNEVNVQPIEFCGPRDLQAFIGLIVSMAFAGCAAELAKVNASKPGVRPFGRQLYRLKVDTIKRAPYQLNRTAAIRRKGAKVDDATWHDHYECAIDTVNKAQYSALILDYDGTLCDTRDRSKPLNRTLVNELVRIAHEGAMIGIATGRGPSAGAELRASLPKSLHERIMIGYYNGALTRLLTDDSDPIIASSETLSPLSVALSEASSFGGRIRENAVQISLELRPGIQIDTHLAEIRRLMKTFDIPAKVVFSGHAVDFCLAHQSKINVIDAMRKRFSLGDGPVVRLGDRGKPLGNDWELLDDRYGLSVDQVSSHPKHCWALAPAGMKGVQATEHYLTRLRWGTSGGRMRLTASRRTQ